MKSWWLVAFEAELSYPRPVDRQLGHASGRNADLDHAAISRALLDAAHDPMLSVFRQIHDVQPASFIEDAMDGDLLRLDGDLEIRVDDQIVQVPAD